MKTIAPSATLRARALDALKVTWPTVLAGSAVINLVSYVLNQIVGAIPAVGSLLSILLVALLTVPMMGLTKGVMGYYRGQPLTFDCVRSMFPHWQKVILLYLWTMLCLMGWLTIGMLPMLIGWAMYAAEASALLGLLLIMAGIVLMLVLVIRAALNYSMSQCILIDDPSTGVRDTLKKSRAMIHGYRWHCVKVGLPVFIILFIAIFVIGAATAVLPGWLASLISTVTSVFSGVLSYYFVPVMYEELRRIGRQ